jgi:hypothetical protein
MQPHHQIQPNELENLAWQYLQECIDNKKEHPTQSGKVVLVKDRHIPTIAYFLRVWLPLQGKPTLSRTTYYQWLKSEDIKEHLQNIEEMFNALALDIVANEGKGIFFAKNKLGMSDRTQIENNRDIEPHIIQITGMEII